MTPTTTKPMLTALGRGLLCRCPNCGKGDLFDGLLAQVSSCSQCGEKLAHYNVGLLLPFVVIMIVAHVIIFAMLGLEQRGEASAGLYLSVMVPLSIVVPLVVIRPIKGGLIGMMWARDLSDELSR